MTDAVKGTNMWNTGNTDDRYEAALRLFGALSGVDEDYLVACEEDAGVTSGTEQEAAAGKNKTSYSGMVRFVQRYGKAMAAILCVAMLGASYLSFRVGVFSGGVKEYADDSGTDSAAPMTGEAFDAAAQESNAAVAEVTEEPAADEAPAAEAAPAEDDAYTEEEAEAQAMDMGAAEDRKEAMKGRKDDAPQADMAYMGDIYSEMTLAEAAALPVVGAYLPTEWPENGYTENVRGYAGEGQETVAVTWTYDNGWDSFVLAVTNLGDADPTERYSDSGNPVFRAENFTKDCVEACILPPQENDGGDTDMSRGYFGVLYRTEQGGCVLVNFNGRGSVDEIWRLMSSIQ